MKYFVYMVENLVNGKKYIGKHIGNEEDGYLGSGVLISKAIKKYGRENFCRIILEEVANEMLLDEVEKKWIEEFDALVNDNFYNLTSGGDGGNTLSALTLKQLKNRLNKIKKTINNHSDEKKNDISKKRSKNMKRLRKNKELEEKRITSFLNTLKNTSNEDKKRRYDKITGENNSRSKKVKTPLGIFGSAALAARAHNISSAGTILYRCGCENFKDWEFI